MAEKRKKVETGFVKIKFTADWGSYKKGDTEVYHNTTAGALIEKEKVAEVAEVLKKYVPKEANK